MIGIKKSEKKFSLLHMEDGESYVLDFYVNATYLDPVYNETRTFKAVLHFCSRSLILEFQESSFSTSSAA